MEQVEEAYATYNEDPFIIPRSMMYLFDKHILADRWLMNKDTLQCWLKIVSEAKQLQNISNDQAQHNTAYFYLISNVS